MKLAEALIERKALKTKMEELKSRIYKNAQTQEGDKPAEEPFELLKQLHNESLDFEKIVIRINKTNNVTLLHDNLTLMECLTKRDMLKYECFILNNLASKATPETSRYSNREIKIVATVDVKEIRKPMMLQNSIVYLMQKFKKKTGPPICYNSFGGMNVVLGISVLC